MPTTTKLLAELASHMVEAKAKQLLREGRLPQSVVFLRDGIVVAVVDARWKDEEGKGLVIGQCVDLGRALAADAVLHVVDAFLNVISEDGSEGQIEMLMAVGVTTEPQSVGSMLPYRRDEAGQMHFDLETRSEVEQLFSSKGSLGGAIVEQLRQIPQLCTTPNEVLAMAHGALLESLDADVFFFESPTSQ